MVISSSSKKICTAWWTGGHHFFDHKTFLRVHVGVIFWNPTNDLTRLIRRPNGDACCQELPFSQALKAALQEVRSGSTPGGSKNERPAPFWLYTVNAIGFCVWFSCWISTQQLQKRLSWSTQMEANEFMSEIIYVYGSFPGETISLDKITQQARTPSRPN